MMSNADKTRSTLFLLSSLAIGGSERKSVRVVNALCNAGHDVRLGYLNGPHTLRDEIDVSVPVRFFDRRGKFSLRVAWALRNFVKQSGTKRIVCINLYPLLYAYVARATLPSRFRPSIVLMVNTTQHADRRAERLMAVYRRLMPRVNRIIFGCKAQRDLWISKYGLKSEICDVIYNGIDEKRFSRDAVRSETSMLRQHLGIPRDAFVIGTVGQLRREKNQKELVSMLGEVKDSLPAAVLVIAGDGPDRDILDDSINSLGLTHRVWLLGQVDDVRPVLANMDVFVLPSISETFSNAALEAMAMGVPVVLTDTGGAREMLEEGDNGFLYQRGEITQLAALLTSMFADREQLRQMQVSARGVVLQRFTSTRMLLDYERRVLS
jgi:glycosyltransferase involved in cell wall biosynthesis